jgi:hypothetical protein
MSECKHPGCIEPAVSELGRYAKLCAFHTEQKKHDQAKGSDAPGEEPVEPQPAPPPLAQTNDTAGPTLTELCAAMEEAHAVYEQARAAFFEHPLVARGR